MQADYHKRLEEIRRQTKRIHAHAEETLHILEYDRHLQKRALEHVEQARNHLKRVRELAEEAHRSWGNPW